MINTFANPKKWEVVEKRYLECIPLDDVGEHIEVIKLDTQGSELDILKSGEKTLKNVKHIKLEVHFKEFYKGQPLFSEVHAWLQKKEFRFQNFERLEIRKNELCWGDAIYMKQSARNCNIIPLMS